MSGTIDLEAVRVFIAVAERGNFRTAAAELGVPRSTVSRRIAALEERLGTRLLQRTTRKVALTDAGAEYLRRCQPALAALEDASKSLSERGSQPRGRLRVSTPNTFGELFLPAVVEQYLTKYPGTEVEMFLTDRHVDLVQEGFDLAFRAGRLPDSSLMSREVGRLHTRCYASPGYLAQHGAPKRPRDLAAAQGQHRCVVYAPLAPQGRWAFREGGRTVHVPITEPGSARVISNSLPIVLDATFAGLGVARVPEVFALEAVQQGKLVEVLEAYAMAPSGMHVVWPSARHVPARVRVFLDLALPAVAKLLSATLKGGSRSRSPETAAAPSPRATPAERRGPSTKRATARRSRRD